jgi:hypothetical protein
MSGEAILATPARPLCEPSHRPPKKDRPKSLSFCSDNTVRRIAADIRNGSKADLTDPKFDFRFTPDNGHAATSAACPKSGQQRTRALQKRRGEFARKHDAT